MRRVAALTLVLALLGAVLVFGPANAARHSLTDDELARLKQLRDEAQTLVHEQMELAWARRTQGAQVNIPATYRGHEKLFSLDTLLFLAQVLTKIDDDRNFKKAVEYFRDYVLRETVNLRVQAIDAEVAALFAGRTFTYQGVKYPYFAVRRLLADEPDFASRQAISDAAQPILEAANPLLAARNQRLTRLARELGFADYVKLSEQFRHVDLDRFARDCRRFLDKTEDDYLEELGWASRYALGLPIERLRRVDLPRLVAGAGKFDEHFPADQALARLTNAMVEMGLTLGRIKVDDADRAAKSPRARCVPVAAPEDVRLSWRPTGGQAAYRSLWQEMGHAQQLANTRTPVWEFRHLGDNATADTFAFLFGGLLDHPYFAHRHLSLEGSDLRNYVRLGSLRQLLMARRFAAMTLYELELHRGAAHPAERFREWMGRAYGIDLTAADGTRYLNDTTDFFVGADYLRAWWLEAMLDVRLEKQFGDRWFTASEAGAFLKNLWKPGQFYDGTELARELDFRKVAPKYFIKRVKRRAAGKY
jgi:hypothetical protein